MRFYIYIYREYKSNLTRMIRFMGLEWRYRAAL